MKHVALCFTPATELARIDALNPALNAYVTVARDSALRGALLPPDPRGRGARQLLLEVSARLGSLSDRDFCSQRQKRHRCRSILCRFRSD